MALADELYASRVSIAAPATATWPAARAWAPEDLVVTSAAPAAVGQFAPSDVHGVQDNLPHSEQTPSSSSIHTHVLTSYGPSKATAENIDMSMLSGLLHFEAASHACTIAG